MNLNETNDKNDHEIDHENDDDDGDDDDDDDGPGCISDATLRAVAVTHDRRRMLFTSPGMHVEYVIENRHLLLDTLFRLSICIHMRSRLKYSHTLSKLPNEMSSHFKISDKIYSRLSNKSGCQIDLKCPRLLRLKNSLNFLQNLRNRDFLAQFL